MNNDTSEAQLRIKYITAFDVHDLGAVHILRQPPEGGEGVWQMLTISDEGGI